MTCDIRLIGGGSKQFKIQLFSDANEAVHIAGVAEDTEHVQALCYVNNAFDLNPKSLL